MVLVLGRHEPYAHRKIPSKLAMLSGSRSSVRLLVHGLEGDVGSFTVNDDLVFGSSMPERSVCLLVPVT